MTFLRKLNKAFAILLVLIASSEGLSATTLDRVVAKVNSDIVTLSTVEDKVAIIQERGILPGASEEEMMQLAVDVIVEEKLQLQEAKRLKLPIEEENVLKTIDEIREKNHLSEQDINDMLKREKSTMEQYKNRIRDQMLISKVISFQLRNRINIGEKEIKLYYTTHQKDFYVVDQVHPRHILFIVEENTPEVEKQKKRQLAMEVLKKIRDGANFSEMARKYSEDVSASAGGDLGFIERGKMVKVFEEAVFKLRNGEVSGIVETPNGLHIIKLEEFRHGRTKLYKEVREEIDQILFSQKKDKEYKAWMDELKKAAFIEVSLFKEPDSKKDKTEDKDLKVANLLEKSRSNVKKNENTQKKQNQGERNSGSSSPKNENSESQKSSKADNVKQAELLDYSSLEKTLAKIKNLREKNEISESEYQKRKKELLDQL